MATSQTTQAASTKRSGAVHPIAPARLNPRTNHVEPVALGTWIWLASDLMFFAALFAAYFMIREVTNAQAHGGQSLWSMESTHLDFPKALLNTLVLVLSSVTCQMGVLAAEHGRVSRAGSLIRVGSWGMREWYTLTFMMGSIFISGQVAEYATLISEHHSIASSVYFSAFFLATGFHGLHVTGGLIAFLFVLGRTYLARTFTHEQIVSAIVISYYWHFVDFVWIILFTTLYILK